VSKALDSMYLEQPKYAFYFELNEALVISDITRWTYLLNNAFFKTPPICNALCRIKLYPSGLPNALMILPKHFRNPAVNIV